MPVLLLILLSQKSADTDKEIRCHQPSSPTAASSCQVTQLLPLIYVGVAWAVVVGAMVVGGGIGGGGGSGCGGGGDGGGDGGGVGGSGGGSGEVRGSDGSDGTCVGIGIGEGKGKGSSSGVGSLSCIAACAG